MGSRLRQDQVQRAKTAGLKATELVGGNVNATAKLVEDMMNNPKAYHGSLVFLTPELWFKNPSVQKGLKKLAKNIGRVVIDEAHYVTTCDDSFRPDYRKLGDEVDDCGLPLMCLTASMTADVVETLISEFHLNPRRDIFIRGASQDFLRTHIIDVEPKLKWNDYSAIVQKVQWHIKHGRCCGMVFCMYTGCTKDIREALREAGIERVEMCQGKMNDKEKRRVFNDWIRGTILVIVATDVLGLGVDKSGIQFIIDANIPAGGPSSWMQHIGRGRGESGNEVHCTAFWHRDDLTRGRGLLRNHKNTQRVDKDLVQHKFQHLDDAYRIVFDGVTCRKIALVQAAYDSDITGEVTACGRCDNCTRDWSSLTDGTEQLKKSFTEKACPQLHRTTGIVEADLGLNMQRMTPALTRSVTRALTFSAVSFNLLRTTSKLSKAKHRGLITAPDLQKLGKPVEEGGVHVFYRKLDHDTHESTETTATLEQGTAAVATVDSDDEATNQGDYPVKRIMDQRVQGGELQYYVEFGGRYDGDKEWLKAANCHGSKDAIAEFESENEAKVQRYKTRTGDPSTRRTADTVVCVTQPPDDMALVVTQWKWLVRWIGDFLVCSEQAIWDTGIDDTTGGKNLIDSQLAEECRLNDLEPLKRLMNNTWEGLPGPGSRHRLEFSLVVSIEDEIPQWQVQWPKVLRRDKGDELEGQTKRIYRRYGSANVLFVKIASGGDDGVRLHQWLRKADTVLEVGGRRWGCPKIAGVDNDEQRFCFFAENAEIGSADRQQDREVFQKHLNEVFTKSKGSPVDLWHFNPNNNREKSISTLAKRTKLQLSTIVPTLTLKPEEIIFDYGEKDPYYAQKEGCGKISSMLIDEAYDMYCRSTNIKRKATSPPQFQGRVGAAKGMWTVDPALEGRKIVIRGHQNKYKLGRASGEAHRGLQCCIEVCSFGTDRGPGTLNNQLLNSLDARMPKAEGRALIKKILTEQLLKQFKSLSDEDECRRFCATAGREGKAILDKLDSGSMLSDEVVQAGLRRALLNDQKRSFQEGIKSKLHITIEASRRFQLVPDEHELLEENEFFMNAKGITNNFRKPAIAARNPNYNAAEVLLLQAVRAYDLVNRMVQKEHESDEDFAARKDAAYEWYQDQISSVVLSVKGKEGRMVADKMSGGDMDGDDVLIIWDDKIVSLISDFPEMVYSKAGGTPKAGLRINKEVQNIWDPSLKPWCVKKPEGQVTIGEILDLEGRTMENVYEAGWQWHEWLVRQQDQPKVISTASKYHERWADLAAEKGEQCHCGKLATDKSWECQTWSSKTVKYNIYARRQKMN